MKRDYRNPEIAEKLLNQARLIAVVGLSDNPARPSYDVASFLQRQGYKIVPVNPRIDSVLGEKSYPDLASIPGNIDVVDIFRKSEDIGPIVDEAISKGAGAIWMQLGIVNEQAADKAAEAGLDVVMDMCMKMEYNRIHG
ncbi:MAG: CoA-binding protein [candidate division Zixibacteria bacterium RBG_16_53_22]|nr:MAG: CoA-binding protein [candidate division Zixibacteria bacterium RBG_16_53_22]